MVHLARHHGIFEKLCQPGAHGGDILELRGIAAGQLQLQPTGPGRKAARLPGQAGFSQTAQAAGTVAGSYDTRVDIVALAATISF